MSDLTIAKKKENDKLIVTAEGRIDTATSPQLDEEVKSAMADIRELVIDFGKVSYISSSGLRVLLSFHKSMDLKGGKLIIKNPTDMVLEVFEVTGFSDILNIEK